MTELQKRFAQEWVIDFNCQKAGERAGIQGDNIRITGWQMLQLPDVQAYIEQLQAEAALRCQITKDEWLNEWKRLGFSNIRDYVEDDHSIKSLDRVKNPEAIKKIKKTVSVSEFDTKTTVEFELHDKPNALTNIGRHLGWYEKDNEQQSKVIVPILTNDPLSNVDNNDSTSQDIVASKED